MPLFLQHICPNYRWAIWKTEETWPELLTMLPQKEKYAKMLAQFSSIQRRKEWLAVRVLLHSCLGEECEIGYHPSGKPFLKDKAIPFSISHTKGYVAVIWGNETLSEVGIDIEQYGDRVKKVAKRFMRNDETVRQYEGTDIWSLLLHWSGKETIYKCLNETEVDFQKHLRILPFTPQSQGCFEACECKTEKRSEFQVHYLLHPDFVLTWLFS